MVVSIANRGHWIAIQANRNGNEISLTIADSMTQGSQSKVSKKDSRQNICVLLKSLIPYHIALSNNIFAWKNVLTEEACNPASNKASSTAPCQTDEADSDDPEEAVPLDEILKRAEALNAKHDQQSQQPIAPANPSATNASKQIAGEEFDRVSISPKLAAVCLENFPEIKTVCSTIEQRKYPVRVIFSGPPNIGKTTLARAIARHLNRPSVFYDCTDGDKYFKTHEERWKNTVKPFIMAGMPCVIIIDEIDQLKPIIENLIR